MPRNTRPLVLEQRQVKRTHAHLHCSETSLHLSDDERELTLRRYIEVSSPEGMQWVERSHRVPVAALMRWIIAHGEEQAVEQGNEMPAHRSAV
ncbi:hypothetical protein [Pseudomonas sp. Irchel s3h17]|uniref:hypothetical protein n=1 Tax=Pseudomonas sp. Irchel s3h17 TaxID=2009182 RepID=UPI000BA2FD84|nr:hypothetical protein [Pseudomonas sp. Irchel s3h17]